ncbi:MAG: hypothetical protein KIT80_14035 [Chitinophagaceae bacterium]|nr:hypothetical protein [Chitinophagaceae bacterium]MCW5928031.1 hypothetical protein [Chitinophagaceae bacterium]
MKGAITNSNLAVAGWLLMFSAITFWVSWFLMPDQGTNDTGHILQVVAGARVLVFYSVIIQVVSSIAYIPALFLLVHVVSPCNKSILWGSILLSIGAMGMCMDGFFHLLAYYMTAESVYMQPAVTVLMTDMQTKGIVLLVPLLLPFFAGTLLLTFGLRKQKIIPAHPLVITIVAFVTAISGAILINKFPGYGRSQLVLTVLGLFAIAQLLTGWYIMKRVGRCIRG